MFNKYVLIIQTKNAWTNIHLVQEESMDVIGFITLHGSIGIARKLATPARSYISKVTMYCDIEKLLISLEEKFFDDQLPLPNGNMEY